MGEVVPRHELEAAVRAQRELKPKQRRSRPEHIPVIPGSLGLAIPLIAVAGSAAGIAGVVAVCIAIVLVNLIVARG